MEKEKLKQYPLRITEETHRKLRLLAADRNMTMNDIVVDLIEREYEVSGILVPPRRRRPIPIPKVPPEREEE